MVIGTKRYAPRKHPIKSNKKKLKCLNFTTSSSHHFNLVTLMNITIIAAWHLHVTQYVAESLYFDGEKLECNKTSKFQIIFARFILRFRYKRCPLTDLCGVLLKVHDGLGSLVFLCFSFNQIFFDWIKNTLSCVIQCIASWFAAVKDVIHHPRKRY